MGKIIKDFIRESFTPPKKRDLNCNSKEHNRIEFFDLAKGVCILLVVLNHIKLFNDNEINIPNFEALRMPLYFVLSGIFFKAYKPKVFFIKKINNILVPFFFWLIASDILKIFGGVLHKHSISLFDLSIIAFLTEPFCRDLHGSLWFLICLFMTNTIYYLAYLILKDSERMFFAILVFAVIGYLLFRFNIYLPYFMDNSLIAIPFFFFGYVVRGLSYLTPEYSKKNSLLLGIGYVLISYIIYYIFNHPYLIISISSFHGAPIMGYLNSIAFVTGTLLLCKVVNWLPVVSYFGRYSIIVLCVHIPIMGHLSGFIEKSLGHRLTFGELAIITILLCWFAIPVIKTYLHYLF